MQVIIYQNDQVGVSIIYPIELCGLSVKEIADKDVPTGKPYAIIDQSLIPTDRTLRDAWTVDPAQLTDGVGK